MGLSEYFEVLAVIAAVTLAAWFAPFDYRVFGDIYLLAVIVLCLRVGRLPIFFAVVASVLAWNFVIVPPRLSFSALDLKDGVFLGTYFVVALIAGQLTARIRAQQQQERQREQRATALFHLTRALSAARTLDDAVSAALRQADVHFSARTALLLAGENGELARHPASALELDATEWSAATRAWSRANYHRHSSARVLHVPLLRAGAVLGVFSVRVAGEKPPLSAEQRELVEAFAAHIALLVEREQLRAASEREKLLAESDRVHRALLDSVSHELRTPLAVLRSAAENLVSDDGARRMALAAEISAATHRLDHVVGNLLNQSRLESGRLTPRLDWSDARDCIAAARRLIGEELTGRPITIDVPADMPFFRSDAALMEQVMANLLLNAARHTPEGTPINVAAGVTPEGDRVLIRVSDRGPGIAPELRRNLFQKFRRGAGAKPGGLGLGLSIVSGFMLAQGGSVLAENNPGGGAQFVIFLPFTPNEIVPFE